MSLPRRAAPLPPQRHVGLLVALLVGVGAIVALVMTSFKEAAIFAMPVEQLLAQPGKYAERRVRIDGELLPGSLKKQDTPCLYSFRIGPAGAVKAGPLMSVRYPQCVVPDTFRDVPQGGVMVTVEGALGKQGDFEATAIMAKCTSKYDPKTHEMKGASAEAASGPTAN